MAGTHRQLGRIVIARMSRLGRDVADVWTRPGHAWKIGHLAGFGAQAWRPGQICHYAGLALAFPQISGYKPEI